MRYIIIGASGFIGNHFYNFLKKRKIKTIGTFNKNYINGLIHFDMTKHLLDNKINNLNAQSDIVFIFSAYAQPAWISKNKGKTEKINIKYTKKLIDRIHNRVKKIIFISSVEVFDGKKKKFNEKNKPNPLNFYGKTKYKIEQYLKKKIKNYQIIRTSWNSDIRLGSRCVIEMTYKTILEKNAKMATDNILSITYVNDFCKALYAAIKLNNKIIHIANHDKISRFNLAKKIKKISKRKKLMQFTKCNFYEIPYKEPRGKNNILNCNILIKNNISNFRKINTIVNQKVKKLDNVKNITDLKKN